MSLHIPDNGMLNREELLAREARIKGKILYKSNNVSNNVPNNVANCDVFSLNKKLILTSVSTMLFLLLSKRTMENTELYILIRGIAFFILFFIIMYFMK